MPRTSKKVNTKKSAPPATTPQGREDQLISLAIDLAEKQLREGTASAQVTTHFLKLASSKEKLEREKLEFPTGLRYEDVEFFYKSVPYLNKVSFAKKAFVHYAQRPIVQIIYIG